MSNLKLDSVKTLSTIKAAISRDDEARNKIAAKGKLAYRMGIERRSNPENLPTSRTIWERGWDAAKVEFEAMQLRWKTS